MALKKIPRKSRKQRVNRKTGFTDQDWTGWEKWDGQKFSKLNVPTLIIMDLPNLQICMYIHIHGCYRTDTIRQMYVVTKPHPHVGVYIAIYARLLLNGMPDFNPKEDEYWQTLAGTTGNVHPSSEYMNAKIKVAIAEGKLVEEKEAKEKAEKARPVICISQQFRKLCEIQPCNDP